MRKKDKALADQLEKKLIKFMEDIRGLPGIATPVRRKAFLEQLLESIHRTQYIEKIKVREISPLRADPYNDLFDPLKAALLKFNEGDYDEACWLVFLATHFGKHLKDGWRLVRDIYAGEGPKKIWTWQRTTANLLEFETWLEKKHVVFKSDGITRRFGNHRRYESLKASKHNRGTAAAVRTYIQWVGANKGHMLHFKDAIDAEAGIPAKVFDKLYNEMEVTSFARLGKFDYLTMLGKLGLVNILPGSPYLRGASGPLRGAKEMFGPRIPTKELDGLVISLGKYLGVTMQEMEDSLCNWQKSPEKFIPFRG